MVKSVTDKHDTGHHGFDEAWDQVKLRARQAWDWLKGRAAAFWAWLKSLPRAVVWIAAAVLVVLVAIIVFLAQPNWDWARSTVSSFASGKLHRKVTIGGHLRVHAISLHPRASVTGLTIAEPSGGVTGAPKENLAVVDGATVTAELMPLFVGHIVLPRLEITRPVVTAYQDAAGHANWDFSDGKAAAQPLKLPLIRNFIINDGHITFTSLQRRLTFTGTVDAHERAGAGRTAFALTGQGSLNGKVFRLNATGGPLLNVRSTTPYPFALTAQAGDTVMKATGQVTHPFDLGRLAGNVSVSGSNMADLYYITGLSLPDTAAYRVSAKVTRAGMVYHIDGINGRVGGSDLEGALKVQISAAGRPDLTGSLSSRSLDFKDLGSLVGATAANAPSAPKLAADPTAAQAARRLLPDVPLDVERVRGMDAHVRYRALSVQTGPHMPLRQVSLGVDLDHGLLVLDPVDFAFPQGHLSGTARIDARQAVQRDAIDFRLTGIAVQQFVPQIQGATPIEGNLSARVKAEGIGNSVHKAASTANGELTVAMPSGTMRQSFAELLGVDASKGLIQLLGKDAKQTGVRCAVADFNVRNGLMQSQSIVFDTDVVRVDGSGSVNLNDESLKVVLKGKPKKFRLVRVDAPIVIGGHLAAPAVGIDAGPVVAQTGLAAVFHTLIPFLGFDLARDANCQGLLADAQAQGAPVKAGR